MRRVLPSSEPLDGEHPGCLALAVVAAVPCFAQSAPSVRTSDIQSIMSAVTDQFSVSNIVTFIAYIIGAGVVFVFLWWGVRKAWNAIMAAATRGKAKL